MSKIKFPVIIDNLFSKKYMDAIEDSCVKTSWSYNNNISYGENTNKSIQDGFAITFNTESHYYSLFQYLIFKSCEKINFEVSEISRIRKRLTYPNKERYNIPYCPHVDYSHNHLVLLYYVNECDGDTFIFDEILDVPKDERNDEIIAFDKWTIKERIEPRKGRIVIFDGSSYHSSSLSSTNNRIVLNIDITGKFKK